MGMIRPGEGTVVRQAPLHSAVVVPRTKVSDRICKMTKLRDDTVENIHTKQEDREVAEG